MSSLSDDKLNAEIGRRLVAVRKALDLAQNAFAEHLGVSPRAYQNWERGEREIPAALLRSLYDEFTIDPLWMLKGPGDEPLDAGVRPNPSLVKDVVLAVEVWLQRRRKTLPTAKKAELVALLYEHFLNGGEVEAKHLNSMLSIAS
jgi:transcriptional regulator with XRE-family HTH domain